MTAHTNLEKSSMYVVRDNTAAAAARSLHVGKHNFGPAGVPLDEQLDCQESKRILLWTYLIFLPIAPLHHCV